MKSHSWATFGLYWSVDKFTAYFRWWLYKPLWKSQQYACNMAILKCHLQPLSVASDKEILFVIGTSNSWNSGSIIIGEKNFTLWAILMWMIYDFSIYGLLLGQVIIEYKACLAFAKGICLKYNSILKKMVYLGVRRFLLDLLYRICFPKLAFNKKEEYRHVPIRMAGAQIEKNGNERE